MNGDNFKTPLTKLRYDPHSTRSTATKRDSFAAELERDPQLSTAKRQQRTQVFNSTISHANLERQLLSAQTTNSELETKLREKELQIERLERDRRWFADREKEEREEKEREGEGREADKRKAESDIRALRTSLATLHEEFADLQDAHSTLSRSTSQTIAAQKSQITTLTHRTTLLEDELSEARQTADERSHILEELQAQYDDLSAQQDNLMQTATEQENMSVVREELHRQASYLRNLESTNAKLTSEVNVLRERHQSIEVLREEKRGLELRLSVLEDLREKVVRLEAEVEAGRRERDEWATKSNELATPSKTPVSVTQSLSDLRLSHARLLEEHGATGAALRRREIEMKNLEQREAEALQTIHELEAQIRNLKEQIGRKESQTMLAEREVGYLHALVASFNAEEAFADAAPVDEAKTQRIQQLESLLQEYKSQSDRLLKEMDDFQKPSLSQSHSRQVSSEELEKERVEKQAIQRAFDELERESKENINKIGELEQSLFELSGEIAGGRHVPPGRRVLCMKENPDQQWVDLRQTTMDKLKGENEALIKRLKEVGESGMVGGSSSGEELVPRESWELVNREKVDLQSELKQKEKRLLRLQQVFTSKSAEFREAIASILGLKLAFYPNGQVRVTSMYDLNASFIFQPASKTEGARMQLVAQGEGGPQDLPNLMHYWIENEQCTPGFLASVTLECYENWKRNGGEAGM